MCRLFFSRCVVDFHVGSVKCSEDLLRKSDTRLISDFRQVFRSASAAKSPTRTNDDDDLRAPPSTPRAGPTNSGPIGTHDGLIYAQSPTPASAAGRYANNSALPSARPPSTATARHGGGGGGGERRRRRAVVKVARGSERPTFSPNIMASRAQIGSILVAERCRWSRTALWVDAAPRQPMQARF